MGWMEAEFERLKSEEKRRIENASPNDYIKIVEGVQSVSVDLSKPPEMINGKYGKRHSVKLVEPDGKRIDMTDKIYETFINAVNGRSGIVKLNIIRTGKTREDTKYVVQVV
jgi:hypothetical protein